MSQQQPGPGGPPPNPPQTPSRQSRSPSKARQQQVQGQVQQPMPLPGHFIIPGGAVTLAGSTANFTQALAHPEVTYDLPYIPYQNQAYRLDDFLERFVQNQSPENANLAARFAYDYITRVNNLVDSGLLKLRDFLLQAPSLSKFTDGKQLGYINSFPNLNQKATQYQKKRDRHDTAIRSMVKTQWTTREFLQDAFFPLIGASTQTLENLRKMVSDHIGPGKGQHCTPLVLLRGASLVMVRRFANLDKRSNSQTHLIWSDIETWFTEFISNTSYGPSGQWNWSVVAQLAGAAPQDRARMIGEASNSLSQALARHSIAPDQFGVYRGTGIITQAIINACQNEGQPVQRSIESPSTSITGATQTSSYNTPSGPLRYETPGVSRAISIGLAASQTSNVFNAHSPTPTIRGPPAQRAQSVPVQQAQFIPVQQAQSVAAQRDQSVPAQRDQSVPAPITPTPTGPPLSFGGLPKSLTDTQMSAVLKDFLLPYNREECLSIRAQNAHYGVFNDMKSVPRVVIEAIDHILTQVSVIQKQSGVEDDRTFRHDIPIAGVVASIRAATGHHSTIVASIEDYESDGEAGSGGFVFGPSPSPISARYPSISPLSPTPPSVRKAREELKSVDIPPAPATPESKDSPYNLRNKPKPDYSKMGSGTTPQGKGPSGPQSKDLPSKKPKIQDEKTQVSDTMTRGLENLLTKLHTMRLQTNSPKSAQKPRQQKGNPVANASELDNAIWDLTYSKVSHKVTGKYHTISKDQLDLLNSGRYSVNQICDSIWGLSRFIHQQDIMGAATYLEGAMDGAAMVHRFYATETQAMGQIRRNMNTFRNTFGATNFARIGNDYNHQGVQLTYDNLERFLVDEGHDGWLDDYSILAGLLHLTRERTNNVTIIPASIWELTFGGAIPTYQLPVQISNLPAAALSPDSEHLFLIPVASQHHWTLLVIRRQGSASTIQHLDSSSNRDTHKRNLNNATQLVSRYPGVFGNVNNYNVQMNDGPRSIQQDNGMDCGLFVLENARAILSGGERAERRPTLMTRALWTQQILDTALEQRNLANTAAQALSNMTGTGSTTSPMDMTGRPGRDPSMPPRVIVPGPVRTLTPQDEFKSKQEAQDGQPGEKRKKQ